MHTVTKVVAGTLVGTAVARNGGGCGIFGCLCVLAFMMVAALFMIVGVAFEMLGMALEASLNALFAWGHEQGPLGVTFFLMMVAGILIPIWLVWKDQNKSTPHCADTWVTEPKEEAK